MSIATSPTSEPVNDPTKFAAPPDNPSSHVHIALALPFIRHPPQLRRAPQFDHARLPPFWRGITKRRLPRQAELQHLGRVSLLLRPSEFEVALVRLNSYLQNTYAFKRPSVRLSVF